MFLLNCFVYFSVASVHGICLFNEIQQLLLQRMASYLQIFFLFVYKMNLVVFNTKQNTVSAEFHFKTRLSIFFLKAHFRWTMMICARDNKYGTLDGDHKDY
ncbi:unnamed protein product [Cuscuta epithymum]|uniref:Secreted protein n=1 Tax=Cuscuta epithymum TaxID=186058 RepID=A0AAV0F4J5_9ASTE|nr:unnamed protein product [Cuscuta epithymum]